MFVFSLSLCLFVLIYCSGWRYKWGCFCV